MKRFAFFMAVFSVSLVLLLVCTGQLGKLFDGSNADDSPPPIATGSGTAIDPSQHNRITWRSIDLKRGRPRWVVSGVLDRNTSLNPDNWGRSQTLTDAYVDIPIHDATAPTEGNSMRRFRIDAKRVAVDPDGHLVTMEGGIQGRGDDGTRFDTTALTLSWSEPAHAGDADSTSRNPGDVVTLKGDQPVSFAYPALRLHGEGGLDGELGNKGLTRMTILPPVVVAVDQARARGFMGLEPTATAPRGEIVEVIILYSEKHPLIIDAEARTARFVGDVTLYRTEMSPTRALFPAPEVTDTWMHLGALELELGKDSMRFTRAEARGPDPDGLIRARYGELHTLAGEHLVWDDGDAQAILTGQVRLTGPLGTFRASQASLYPNDERAVLEGNVTAELEQPGTPAADGDDPDKARPARRFHFRADRLEIAYRSDDPTPGRARGRDRGMSRARQRVRELTATSRQPNGVEIVEIEPSGLVVRGSIVRYEQAQDRFVVLPRPGGAVRPVLESDRGHMVADRIEVALTERVLRFDGGVEGRLGSPRTIATGGFLSTLRCGALAVRFTETRDMDVDDVRVTGAAELHNVGATSEPFHAFGEEIHWQRGAQRLSLTGTGARPARLQIDGGEFRARQIVYDARMQRVTADGDVEVRTTRVVPPGTGHPALDDPQLVVHCDHFVGTLAGATSARPQNGADFRARGAARAWCDEGRQVLTTLGDFHAEAQELRYDATTGVLELTGEGRQRILQVGESGRNQLSAHTIRVSPTERWVELQGEVQATIFLDFLETPEAAKRAGRHQGTTPWLLEARRARVTFVEIPRAGGGGAHTVLEPSTVSAEDVVLANAELDVRAEGSRLAWSRHNQKLRIYSDGGTRRQIFHRGPPGLRDEVVAREVSLVLVPAHSKSGKPGHLNVLLDDVPDAILHHRDDFSDPASGRRAEAGPEGEPVPAIARIPGQYRLRTDHLLLVIERQAMGARAEVPAPIREALAWGRVLFEGGRYTVRAHRCRYQGNPERLFFYGQKHDPVRVSVAGQDVIKGNPVILRKTRSGYELETRGRYPWRAEELREFLRLHQAETGE